MLSLKTLKVQPPGFGNCKNCPYFEFGPAALCFACAHDTIVSLAQANARCGVCDLPFEANEDFCRNPICNWADHRKFFNWNYSIAMRTGLIERIISQYKFNNQQYWATIFARVLTGFFEEHPKVFKQFDLIVASPTYIVPPAIDHTRRVMEIAHVESRGEWPFDVGEDEKAIIKTADTPKMKRQPSWKKRDEIAQTELRNSLAIPDTRRTKGKTILVYDDIFTDGHTLNEVARCLRLRGGAKEVCGVTLARQPFGKRANAS